MINFFCVWLLSKVTNRWIIEPTFDIYEQKRATEVPFLLLAITFELVVCYAYLESLLRSLANFGQSQFWFWEAGTSQKILYILAYLLCACAFHVRFLTPSKNQ